MTGKAQNPSTAFKEALRNPGSVFSAPREVLEHAAFTPEQKIEILRNWEYDAVEESVAEEEGMPDGDNGLLQDILLALDHLTGGLDQDHSPPTKHGGLDNAAVRRKR